MAKSSKKILLVGGAGFIGAHLTKKLVLMDFNVCVFDNLSNPSKIYEKSLCKQEYGDVSIFKDVSNCIKSFKPDFIINLSAYHYIPDCEKDPKKTLKVNVMGTKNILKSISQFSPQAKFIFTSSAAVYAPDINPHKETSKLGPIDVYGRSKIKAEEIIQSYCEKFKIDYCILRLFNVYGYGNNTPHLIPTLISQIKSKNNKIYLGNFYTERDYVYVDSVVDVFLKIIKRFRNKKTFNVGTGVSYSALDVANFLKSKISANLDILGDKKRIRKNDRIILLSDISKIKSSLNWKPIHFKSGMKKLMKKEGLL